MEGSNTNESVFNKMFNPEVFKLERFDDTNFTRWKDKVLFLLTELGIAYLLATTLEAILEPNDNDTPAIIAARRKR